MINVQQIKPDMPVVCSQDGQFAVVDHMEGGQYKEIFNMPSLIIHGTADRILPYVLTAQRMQAVIKGSKLVSIEGGPHRLTWTHAEIVNRELLDFINAEGVKRSAA